MPEGQNEIQSRNKMNIFEEILKNRGIYGENRESFLNPDYDSTHNPFLLPDMDKAVDRIHRAHALKEKITIYGDYDIDGLTASTLLLDALGKFGFTNLDVFIPNRFVDGYGLTTEAIESIASTGTNLIITVDCGSLSHGPIERCNELGLDIIVTDHHNVAEIQPNAISVINPKRIDHKYPFRDLAGVGVAFKLVQALQTKLKGLPKGQEKWLLDLVALGTICDIVPLLGENRVFAYYGLKVLSQTKRPGLQELMKVSGVNPKKINSKDVGFALGPRMNAAGRLETAQYSLDMLRASELRYAQSLVDKLNKLNQNRRKDQEVIFQEASAQAENDDRRVLVLCSPLWNHGIVGIVASKIVEKFKKPTFVLQDLGTLAKGSARSIGDFSVAEAIKFASDTVKKGGGHHMAAGVTLYSQNIETFRDKVNQYYDSLKLKNQEDFLLPKHDLVIDNFRLLNIDIVNDIAKLEPFGNSNQKPVLKINNLTVSSTKLLGAERNHLKIELQDSSGMKMEFIKFSNGNQYNLKIGQKINIWSNIEINDWNSAQKLEGLLIDLEIL